MEWVGTWENQNGSRLVIDVFEGSHFYGSFESKKGRAVEGQSYPVHGSINDELIGFVVDFGEVGSLVNFSGRTSEDGALHTLWVLAREYVDEDHTRKTQPWNSFMVNSDVFHKIS